ncbi:hypothetical protein E4K10_47390 [Streptomyces sp. T1317-0309]|nr:hypothetical protein E4K10_47390 [Streptomyces sp. T1317-0309]
MPFSDAAVGLLLESPGAPAESQPIAWSIRPRNAPPAGGSRQTKLGLTAKLAIVQPNFEYTKQDQEREFKVVGMGSNTATRSGGSTQRTAVNSTVTNGSRW